MSPSELGTVPDAVELAAGDGAAMQASLQRAEQKHSSQSNHSAHFECPSLVE